MLSAYGRAGDPLDPAVSTRRFGVLLERLPPHARRPGEQWSTESDLLALLIDHLANLTYVTLKANGAKSAKRPKPLPRPGDDKGKKRGRNRGSDREDQRRRDQRRDTGRQRQMSGWAAAADQLTSIPGIRLQLDASAVGLQISDAERDTAISAVKASFTAGRLAMPEAERRMGQAMSARTHGDLAEATDGLPGAARG